MPNLSEKKFILISSLHIPPPPVQLKYIPSCPTTSYFREKADPQLTTTSLSVDVERMHKNALVN